MQKMRTSGPSRIPCQSCWHTREPRPRESAVRQLYEVGHRALCHLVGQAAAGTAHQHIVNPRTSSPTPGWRSILIHLMARCDHRGAIANHRATFLAVLVVTAVYGWVLGIEIERASESGKSSPWSSPNAKRFARDLHDGLGQTLTGWRIARERSPGAWRDATRWTPGSFPACSQMRWLKPGPSRLPRYRRAENGGLQGGLQWLGSNTGGSLRSNALSIYRRKPLTSGRNQPRPPPDRSRIRPHAIRHGNASVVSLSLHPEGKGWLFEIRDNGNGRTAQERSHNRTGPAHVHHACEGAAWHRRISSQCPNRRDRAVPVSGLIARSVFFPLLSVLCRPRRLIGLGLGKLRRNLQGADRRR